MSEQLRQVIANLRQKYLGAGTAYSAAHQMGWHSALDAVEATLPAGGGARQKCCERDTDGDGNCPVHSAPGVFRTTEQRFSLVEASQVQDRCTSQGSDGRQCVLPRHHDASMNATPHHYD